MKIIIFGSTGFIGSHLKKLPYEIVPVNCRDKKYEEWSRDIPDDAEVFINCIGKAHDHSGTAQRTDFDDANYHIVTEIFRAFMAKDASLFIHTSSIAAVEEFESDEILTEEFPCNPLSFYGKSKFMAEKFLQEQKLPPLKKIIVLRPAMVHGSGDKGNLSLLYKLISKGVPYPLGQFSNSRSFVSIENFVYVVQKIIKNKDTIPAGIYHISDDEPVSTKSIIALIGKVNSRKAVVLNINKSIIRTIASLGDMLHLPFNSKRITKMTATLVVSNAKIKTALGIDKLPVSAEEGLIKTIKSFRK